MEGLRRAEELGYRQGNRRVDFKFGCGRGSQPRNARVHSSRPLRKAPTRVRRYPGGNGLLAAELFLRTPHPTWGILSRSQVAPRSERQRSLRMAPPGARRPAANSWRRVSGLFVLRNGRSHRDRPSLLPDALRLYRAHEPLLVLGRGDGRGEGPSPIQREQHRAASTGNLRLQLLLPSRLPRRPRRAAAAPLPCSLCFVEVRQGMGTLARAPRASYLILSGVEECLSPASTRIPSRSSLRSRGENSL